MSLLARSQWRHWLRHPWLLLLSVFGVAVGVAGVVAMDLAIRSCERAFALSQETLTGKATHWVVAGPAGVPETLYRELRLVYGLDKAAPVVEGYVSVGPQDNPQSFRLLGIDPIADAPFRGGWLSGENGAGGDLTSAFASADAVALTGAEARRLGVQLDGALPLADGAPLRVRAVLQGLKPNLEQALQGQLLCDIAVAQERLGMVGRLSRIELILPANDVESWRRRLPSGVSLVVASTRSRATEQMSAAFFLNLRALSLLSLLVGAFLIYNVIHFLALQRRPWIGQLRILGVTAGEVRAQLLAEAAWLGAWGSVLGLFLGISLSRLLLPLLTRTINDLYYNLQVQETYLSPAALAKGCFLGWGCALLAAWIPAQEAAQAAPTEALRRSGLETRSAAWARNGIWISLVLLTAAWTILLTSTRLDLNLLAMFGIIVGCAGMVPGLVLGAQHALLRTLPQQRWLGLKLVLGGIERSLSRVGVALMAMTVALSAVISITLMVHSFRLSLQEWLERTLSADLYIGRANRQATKAGQGLSPAWLSRLQRHPAVERLLQLKMAPVLFRSQANEPLRPTQIVAQPYTPADLSRLRLRQGRFFQPGATDEIMASEPFLKTHRLEVGSTVELETPSGKKTLQLVGAFQDYASDTGYLVCDLGRYQEWFRDPELSGVSVFLREPDKAEQVRAEILSWRESAGLEIRSQRALRTLSLEIFEQTFQVTRLLQVLAVLVATCGILGAVAANRLERRREWALWGSLGLTRREILGIAWGEASLCGLWAGLAAWPCGLLQAYAMVAFINRRAFGWTLDFHVDWPTLLVTPLLGLAAASLAVACSGVPSGGLAEDLRQE
jgi:putative ABC transport system permease protein